MGRTALKSAPRSASRDHKVTNRKYEFPVSYQEWNGYQVWVMEHWLEAGKTWRSSLVLPLRCSRQEVAKELWKLRKTHQAGISANTVWKFAYICANCKKPAYYTQRLPEAGDVGSSREWAGIHGQRPSGVVTCGWCYSRTFSLSNVRPWGRVRWSMDD